MTKILKYTVLVAAILFGNNGLLMAQEADDAQTDDVERESVVEEAEVTVEPLPADYSIKLKDLEQRVNQLKERIHQSKARLVQLQEVVINGTITGARAKIVHKNELGRNYVIERIQYALDSQPIFNHVAVDGDLTKKQELVVFDDTVAPGNHLLSVYMELRGDGHKFFTYLNNYQFKMKSSHTFSASEGKVTTVTVVPQLKGNMTYSMKERPSVRYDVERKKALRDEITTSKSEVTKDSDNVEQGKQ